MTVSLLWSSMMWSSIVLLLLLSVNAQEPCSVCFGGIPVPDGDKPVSIPVIPVGSCQDLDLAVGFLTSDSADCGLVRTLGPFCGCPFADDGCQICGANGEIQNLDFVLPGVTGLTLTPDVPSAAALAEVTCDLADSVIKVAYTNGMPQCTEFTQQFADQCGCISAPTAAPNFEVTEAPVPEPPPAHQCTFCMSGREVPLLEKPIHLGNIPAETCGELDDVIDFLTPWSEGCQQLRRLGPLCGCESPLEFEAESAESPGSPGSVDSPVEVETCRICPANQTVLNANQYVNVPASRVLPGDTSSLIMTCELLQAALKSYQPSDPVCADVDMTAIVETCGCREGNSTDGVFGDPSPVGVPPGGGSGALTSSIHMLVLGISLVAAAMMLL